MVKRNIPNMLTILNMIAGISSIVLAYHSYYLFAGYCIYAALVLDFLDGFIASRFNLKSEFGKHLDSFADLVSFAVAPSFLLFVIFWQVNIHPLVCYSPFVIVIISSVRLVNFNISPLNNQTFKGLPTPINALFWVGWVNISITYDAFPLPLYEYFFVLILLTFAFLMLCKIEFFRLDFSLKRNKRTTIISLIFCVLCLGLIVIFQHSAPFYIAPLYIILALF